MNQYNGDDTPVVCMIGKIRVFEEALSWLRERHKCGLTALSWELSTSFPWNTKRPNSFLSPDCGHDAGWRYSGCRTEINCVSYWVTRTVKPFFEMCCFNVGIARKGGWRCKGLPEWFGAPFSHVAWGVRSCQDDLGHFFSTFARLKGQTCWH